MKVELYAGPRDGEIITVPDDCHFVRTLDEENVTVYFSFRVGERHAYYFPDHRVIQPYGHMRFAFGYMG